MTETINGLHRCQPKNEPQLGQVKTFLVIHNPAKQGKKPWIAIKSAAEDKGGTPYRIVSVESTGWKPDQYGNQSYNLEVEAAPNGSAFQQTKAAMHPDDQIIQDQPVNAPQSPPHAQQGEDGVMEARKHLMRCCNLYNLCIAAVDKAIAPNMPEIARTSEQFQATLASLWIEASSRRSTNGVDWWSYVDRMPDTPVPNGKHSATAKRSKAKPELRNDPLEEHPMNPINQPMDGDDFGGVPF